MIMNLRRFLTLCILIVVSLSFFPLAFNEHSISDENFTRNIKKPFLSSDEPNSKPLLIHQFASTSNSFFPLSLPSDVHFTLVNGWTSKNITINYEGVAVKMDSVLNGEFKSNSSNWQYKTNNPTRFPNNGWQAGGYMEIGITAGSVSEADHGYYEQNLTISEPFFNGNLALLSIDYFYDTGIPNPPENLTLYMGVNINGVEVNETFSFSDLVKNSWTSANLIYDPSIIGQILPGNISIKAGIYGLSDLSVTGTQFMHLDNIKYEIWTMPNQPYLLKAKDLDFNSNYTYNNLTFGRGYSFINIERIRNTTSNVFFTVFQNITDVIDMQVSSITISSDQIKIYNSTYNGKEGSYYSIDQDYLWKAEFLVSYPLSYINNTIKIEKPDDWNVINIFDSFETELTSSCLGTGVGSKIVSIPTDIVVQGLWKIEATIINYLTNCSIAVWNGNSFEESSSLTYGDKFQVQAILNNNLTLGGTTINCTIRYPNGSIFSDQSLVASFTVVFGNYTVDHRMEVGKYEVLVVWTNNASYIKRDKVGFKKPNFIVWHHTNLQAVNPYFETIAGDPLLVKVNFTDSDIGSFIDFASITYNTTYGSKGIGVYIGSGIYYIDLDTSSLGLGDYYLSFNASKTYYQNQSAINLIQIKIIAEALALQLPRTILVAEANSFINIQINVTGYETGNYLWPVNISTDWQENHTIINFNNGTWIFNLSMFNLPSSGIPEYYTITFMANKSGYSSTTDSIILRIDPIPTVANVNQTIFQVHPENQFNLELNYTVESTGQLILGADISITWPSTYNYSVTPSGFLVLFNTSGLLTDLYTIYIELNLEAYETAFTVVHVMIIPAETQLTLLNIEPIEIIKGDKLNISCLYTSDGQNLLNSTLQLIGNINGTFLWNGMNFYCTINTQDLETKSHLIQILATNQNYEPQLRDLIITIFALEIEIQIPSTTYTLEQGKDNKVYFAIYDKSHYLLTTEFDVTYEINGISKPLSPFSIDSYQIDLNALDLNPLKPYHQITITVLNPYGEHESITIIVYTSLFEVILTIALISIVSVAGLVALGIFISKRYLGLSKFQRRIRTVKRRLKREKFEKIKEPSRENIIKNLLEDRYSGPKKITDKVKRYINIKGELR